MTSVHKSNLTPLNIHEPKLCCASPTAAWLMMPYSTDWPAGPASSLSSNFTSLLLQVRVTFNLFNLVLCNIIHLVVFIHLELTSRVMKPKLGRYCFLKVLFSSPILYINRNYSFSYQRNMFIFIELLHQITTQLV